MKRLFDILASAAGLALLSPLFITVSLFVKLTSRGPVFFLQERVGRHFRPFKIIKFRTMVVDAPKLGGQLTVGDDHRITWFGRFLRKTKIDELPQLVNVLIGDMSLVGPRPEVARYVEMFRNDYEQLLSVRPGITDLASLRYRNESELLRGEPDPEAAYKERILPEKIELSKQYVRRSSFWFDLSLILRTVFRLSV